MKDKLTELRRDFPEWIEKLTKEEQYDWYLKIKDSLPLFKKLGSTSKIEEAIADYEKKVWTEVRLDRHLLKCYS